METDARNCVQADANKRLGLLQAELRKIGEEGRRAPAETSAQPSSGRDRLAVERCAASDMILAPARYGSMIVPQQLVSKGKALVPSLPSKQLRHPVSICLRPLALMP